MVNYNEYPLDVDMYGTLISIAGDIVKINDDRSVCTVVSDDGIDLDVIIHPAVTEAYDKNACRKDTENCSENQGKRFRRLHIKIL